jgi:hypothetical protein
MNPDAEAGPVGLPDEVKPNSPRPGNVQDLNVPEDTGFLIVRLKPGTITSDLTDFGTAVREAGLLHIDNALNAFNLTGTPLITSAPRVQLRKLEEKTAHHKFAPDHSLLSYWRIDGRRAGEALGVIEAALRLFPEVDLVYREKTVTDPLMPGNDPHSALQGYLDQPEAGLNIRWVWDLPYGHGEAMRFIDLEQEWILDHEDLPSPTLIFNDNRKGEYEYNGDHGTGVVGVVAGVDNAAGIIGIAPKVEPIRLVSRWSRAYPTASYIAEAITKAITTPPLPHVLLIEAQTEGLKLPPEMDASVLDAIRLSVSSGVIVVETAGNGNRNLDAEPDAEGQLRLNRNSAYFKDSGAILVGAATSGVPHERSIWGIQASNYASRIDCYAWGDSIVTCGNGDLGGSGVTSYRKDFGGTSGAAAIIAGCALLLQGLHFAKKKSLLSPAEMRSMLSNPKTGIAPGVKVAGHIAVMPNLRAIVEEAKLGPNFITKILRLIFGTRM